MSDQLMMKSYGIVNRMAYASHNKRSFFTVIFLITYVHANSTIFLHPNFLEKSRYLPSYGPGLSEWRTNQIIHRAIHEATLFAPRGKPKETEHKWDEYEVTSCLMMTLIFSRHQSKSRILIWD